MAGAGERSTLDLAECLNSEGNLASDSGRLAEAEAIHQAVLDFREGLAAANPNQLELRLAVARSLINLGNVMRRLGSSRDRDTERMYRDAVETSRAVVGGSDIGASERRLLALALNNRGVFFRDNNRLVKRESTSTKRFDLRQALAAEFPENPDYHNDVAGTLGNLALADLRAGDASAAEERLDEARPHNDAALKANPDHPTYRLFHRNNSAWRGHAR